MGALSREEEEDEGATEGGGFEVGEGALEGSVFESLMERSGTITQEMRHCRSKGCHVIQVLFSKSLLTENPFKETVLCDDGVKNLNLKINT